MFRLKSGFVSQSLTLIRVRGRELSLDSCVVISQPIKMSAKSSIIAFVLLYFSLIAVQSMAGSDSISGGGGVCAEIELPGTSCPINCFRADPVCGSDGVTYWCGCPDAACSHVSVVKKGACDAGNGGSSSVPGQALLLVHILWLVLLGFSMLFGLF